ncbi:MAG: hypothetical protein M0Z96_09225, partial [Actinomycetota bacterium]|nr:hypothetical protein [Actinomycetota bacterium]
FQAGQLSAERIATYPQGFLSFDSVPPLRGVSIRAIQVLSQRSGWDRLSALDTGSGRSDPVKHRIIIVAPHLNIKGAPCL